MKYAVIDVGSNSVRLMINSDGVTAYKKIQVTGLARGMTDATLAADSAKRTADAVNAFAEFALTHERADKLMIFATEAVRSAKNSRLLLSKIEYPVDVIDGRTEAEIGYAGACRNARGRNLVIDIGGASTEAVAGENGRVFYAVSVPIGVVRLANACGQNVEAIKKCVSEYSAGYGKFPDFDRAVVIGGTGLNLAAASGGIIPYDPKKVDGLKMTADELSRLSQRLASADTQGRIAMGIDPSRCDLIVGGSLLLLEIMRRAEASEVFASEGDNLEGYLYRHMAEEGYAR